VIAANCVAAQHRCSDLEAALHLHRLRKRGADVRPSIRAGEIECSTYFRDVIRDGRTLRRTNGTTVTSEKCSERNSLPIFFSPWVAAMGECQ